jgi:biotin carboxylase
VLLLAALFKLPYRVLRCAAQTGATVFVLGSRKAGGLRHSRYCQRFFNAESRIDGRLDTGLILEINRMVSAFSIDLVAAADAPSTRSLVEIAYTLDAPCFPMPELGAFDLLNDKWRFTQLCREMGIVCPESRLFDTAEQLRAECRRGGVAFPFIAKPLSQDSGNGCIRIPDPSRLGALAKITYSPIIVQKFISGADIGASIFCRDGGIETFLTHSYAQGVYTAYDEPQIFDHLSGIARRFGLSGIYNFDMRLTPDGEVFFLECNPRVYYKMAMSMLAGFNFLEPGFPWRREVRTPGLKTPITVKLPKAMLPLLPTPWKLDADARRVLRFHISDPLPYLRERLGLEKGG